MAGTASSSGGTSSQPPLALLREHFNKFQGENYSTGWSSLWERGDFLPWDKGYPSPALAETLIEHRNVIGGAMYQEDGQSRRKKALVPGCGRGVDVLLLESFGYDAVGIEISEGAVKACHKFVDEHAHEYPVMDEKAGRGSTKFIFGDFYKDDWLEKAGLQQGEKFDLIYDYTFFCAMQPSMRPAWAKRMSDLLKPSTQANLICLEHPTEKPPSTGGPPFGSPPKAYMEHLSHPGKPVKYDADGNVLRNPLAESSPGALERVGHWHPKDTHPGGKDEAGNVKNYIAIWRHR